MNSREKGRRGEVELSHVLNDYGYSTRRGQQFSGANGDADVVGLPGIHIECKRVEHLNLDKAMEQAVNDTFADSIKQGIEVYPAVFHRANDDHRKDSTKGRWKVTMLLSDWMKLFQAWELSTLPFKEG